VSVAPSPVSRLSPCPCGSGKRYKDCHGSLANLPGAAPAAAAAPRSSYRPSGPEWDALQEAERDRLGASMEAALIHQRAGRGREAERHYREVLAVAPQTHDALHMLGMARWTEGDYVEARSLVEAALPLRDDYPAIRQNLALIVSAQRARERSAEEALCERALPRLFELLRLDRGPAQEMPAAAGKPKTPSVHLIGVDDGSESDDAWMLRRLTALLESAQPVLWGRGRDAVAAPPAAVGVQIWAGVDVEIEPALAASRPRRTLVFAQSASPSRWLEMLRAIAADGARPLELVVDSQAKAHRFGNGHHVLPIPLDLEEFAAAKRPAGAGYADFVVGNVVADGRAVAHLRAGSQQERVATAGYRLDLYDPGRVRYALGALRNVRHFSRHDVTLVQFLSPLSCYLYCSEAWWKEGLGRDLFGAMALGIPVLCPRTSIHAEYIRDGVDGILYDNDAGALEALASLRSDPARRTAMGAAARDSAQRRFDGRAIAHAYRRLVSGA
jgi:hypothetical protein